MSFFRRDVTKESKQKGRVLAFESVIAKYIQNGKHFWRRKKKKKEKEIKIFVF